MSETSFLSKHKETTKGREVKENFEENQKRKMDGSSKTPANEFQKEYGRIRVNS